ncbi:MAG: cobaltochelatase subunit CobN [Nitratireductor sp.]|nr:cobaltochelatase subunit CobN [Nitratireductor sp.]
MHLLLAQKGAIQEGEEAVDLGQSPGDILFLSAADTELASLADAAQAADFQGLRLANVMQLSHPMSVDVYADAMVAGARLIVVRLLGGRRYWEYGVETLHARALSHGVKLAFLPGDDKPDPELLEYSTVGADAAERLRQYLVEGGPQNAAAFLDCCRHLTGEGEAPPDAVPLLKAGLWWPGRGVCDLAAIEAEWQADELTGRPVIAICFYRALVQSGGLQPIEALVDALKAKGLNALPVFISSLKDGVSQETVRSVFARAAPSVVLASTGFAVSSPTGGHAGTVLDETGAVVLQIVLSGGSLEAWRGSSQGLSARDLAMNVALPEVDGRVLSRAVAFKAARRFDVRVEANIVRHEAEAGRVDFVADLAARWARLRRTSVKERKVAIILANYPNRDGRLGNGVGLDTPAGTVRVLRALRDAGYGIGDMPADGPFDGDALMRFLQDGPTNAGNDGREIRIVLPLEAYREYYARLPEKVRGEIDARWGAPANDPYFVGERNGFALPLARLGNIVIGIQPARGYHIDPAETYHSPDLVPPHGYLAFYAWLREAFGAQAVVHMGKHGNLEWLPGKALALSETCYPEAVFGPMPHLYPFIVNDPGEGSQAKRRTSAVIVDHLTPPLTRAESYGPLRDLEALVDEYYEASGNDPRRLRLLKKQILDLIADIGLDVDAGIVPADGEEARLEKLDGYLCELKEMQIRDGLHVFGEAPSGRLLTDLAVALVRVPRGDGQGANASLHRAIADDLGLSPQDASSFDPLDCDMAKAWDGPRPEVLTRCDDQPWRTQGDTVERIELLAAGLVAGAMACLPEWHRTAAVMAQVRERVLPDIAACGAGEIGGLLAGLDGRFVPPGPSGAPSRGRNDVLPTGRNFFSVDSRAVPTQAAWELGRKSAELLITRYRQDHGDWPVSFGLSAWGTSNMRTGGDDIAQALALIGARPVWDGLSRRVTGYEIVTLAELGRPRVDVTLRISGFFRDAFPAQIELFDKAIRAVGALEEEARDNPIADRMRRETESRIDAGEAEEVARHKAGYRIFGSKPGAYGAGLQALIDEKGWERRGDLAEAYLAWGGYAYGARDTGSEERDTFRQRLSGVEAVIHNQDNREHDLLDSDDYYQFEGGMTAAVEHVSGARPKVYHNDHSRPERPVVRALEEEIARVVRGRCANPKWIEGVMRHGYKGAFEMVATVDYLFAFSATTGAVANHHFELVYDAYLGDEKVRDFIARSNPAGLKEMAERFLEAEARGLWTPRSNSAKFLLDEISGGSAASGEKPA